MNVIKDNGKMKVKKGLVVLNQRNTRESKTRYKKDFHFKFVSSI